MPKPVKPASIAARPRGRPRSEAAKQKILREARALLAEGGPGAVTMEAVAARAGVGKPTVYRWWPNKHAVAMAALMEGPAPENVTSKKRSALVTLRDQLRAVALRLATATGRHVTSLIAASDSESELSKAFRGHFVLARRAEGHVLLERAVANGEVRADFDIDVALDLVYGALFFRLLMGHAAIDHSFTDRVLDQVLLGIKAQKPPRRR